MAIEQQPDGRWKVDVEPIKGKRFRKTFKTKAEAQRFEATCRAKVIDAPAWSPKPKDRRRLSDLIDRWATLHAHTLSDGEARRRLLDTLAKDLGNPIAIKLTGNEYAEYRTNALKAGANPKTLNNRLGYLRSVFNVLFQLSDIDYPNPLARVRPLRLQEKELAYLTDQQIEKLFATIHSYCRTPHVAMIAAICLATGARWGEAQALTPEKVRNQLVTFVNTKGKRVRSIPVAQELEQQIHRHFKQHGQFSNCLNSFDKALAESRLPVPAGQSSHVLRHTFASHFVMSGGNILTLQKILGHTTLAMTMRYTHLAPDHLQDAIKLGPVSDYTKLLGEGVAMHGVPA
ncbi:Site-specific recombinase XerD [Pseudomonas peli]|uniref:Site-specific recombinase XerD n=1 Tax=Pseudomonas peli TaxID=592361 RepID=A0AB37Z815_9PSED|nr:MULTISPECIES: tyrosine-type recombinase/integrase [Pseudomonas]NMZ70080.1 tyrosine-type recombinase/integrase [Pseudomonas peli]SCW65254.1 Site-specific recombinase XerD [Pseudomonas peli]